MRQCVCTCVRRSCGPRLVVSGDDGAIVSCRRGEPDNAGLDTAVTRRQRQVSVAVTRNLLSLHLSVEARLRADGSAGPAAVSAWLSLASVTTTEPRPVVDVTLLDQSTSSFDQSHITPELLLDGEGSVR